jgi:hypothetical protein
VEQSFVLHATRDDDDDDDEEEEEEETNAHQTRLLELHPGMQSLPHSISSFLSL